MLRAKPERLALLSPEQRAIYECWCKESEETEKLLNQWEKAIDAKDLIGAKNILQQVQDNLPIICEHDKPVLDFCAGCEEIERIAFPEFFHANGDRLSDDQIDRISLDLYNEQQKQIIN